jgi:hypothetical protein
MNAIYTSIWIYSHDTRDPKKQLVAQNLIATLRPLAPQPLVHAPPAHKHFLQSRSLMVGR